MAIQRTIEAGKTTVTFILTDDAHDGPVSVVGSFNDWQPGAHLLENDANGHRSVEVLLPDDADVHFRYLGSGGVWFDDPDSDQVTANGSILLTGASSPSADVEVTQVDDAAPTADSADTDALGGSGELKPI
jgi:hypothetical protein